MSTNKNTPQAKKAETQQGADSADPAVASEIASVESTPQDSSEPLAEVPAFLIDSLIERKMKEGYLGSLPETLCYCLHKIPRSMWPSPTPMELARLVVACGWTDDSDGTRRAMDLLWQSALATCNSQFSAERWVGMIESEAPNEVRLLAADIGQDLTKLPDSISHSEFIRLFNADTLTIGGKKMRSQDLFDHWIQLPGSTEYLSSDTLSQIRNDLPNFHANMKKHRAKAEDWSSSYAPHEKDWLRLAEIVREFKNWRSKTAEENKVTGKDNLLVGNKQPNAPPPEAKPPGETSPAGETNQVKKPAKKQATQKDEITPAQAKKIKQALDAALNSPKLSAANSGKPEVKLKRKYRSRRTG